MKTINIVLLFSLTIFMVNMAKAQNPTVFTLAICKLTTQDCNVPNQDVETQMQAFISNVVNNSGRFKAQSLEGFTIADNQINNAKNNDYITIEIVRQGRRVSAKKVIYGLVTSLSCDQKQEKDSGTGETNTVHIANIKYVIRYLDVETGVELASKAFQANGQGANQTEAVKNAINSSGKEAINWIREMTPEVQGDIIRIKKDYQKDRYEVVVKIGTESGMNKATPVLNIKYVDMVAGTPVPRKIAKLIVENVTEKATTGFVDYKNYRMLANQIQITKDFDELWESDKSKIKVDNDGGIVPGGKPTSSYFSFGIGGLQTQINNSSFYKTQNLSKASLGLELGLSYSYSMLEVEGLYSMTRIDSQRLFINVPVKDTLKMSGWSIGFKIKPLKSFIFSPFAGFGYQSNNINSESFKQDLSGIFWKAGFDINVSKYIFIRAEYNRAITKQENFLDGVSLKAAFRLHSETIF